MPEPRVRVYCEGPDDRAVIVALQKGGVFPERLEMAPPSGGEGNLAHDVAPFVSPELAGGRALVLRDHDDLDVAGIGVWFERALRAKLSPAVTLTATPVGVVRYTVCEATSGTRRGLVAVIPVGKPSALDLHSIYGVLRFAVDDYLLALAREIDIYEALVKGEKEIEVGHMLAHRSSARCST